MLKKMKAQYQNSYLAPLTERLEALSSEVVSAFGNLDEEQLNWKPSRTQWSIGECLHHLIVTNRQYFTQFDALTELQHRRTFWERMPGFWHQFWGSRLVEYLGPEVKRKSKSPAVFRPASSRLSVSLIGDFANHQSELIRKIEALDKNDHKTTIVTSPVATMVTYSLHDALLIITGHEERHIGQAKRVMQHEQFPSG